MNEVCIILHLTRTIRCDNPHFSENCLIDKQTCFTAKLKIILGRL